MPLETETLELGDIQGLVVRAYRMPRAVYLFYRFTAAAPARAWLGAMADPVTTAAEWDAKPAWCANLGLTHPGFAALGLPEESLGRFPDDFRQGMAARAASGLGDVGTDLPAHWEATPPFATRGVHAVVLVSARSSGELDARAAELEVTATAHGLVRVGLQPAAALGPEDTPSDREHFGFRDGISQPTIRGSGLEDTAHADRLTIAPGEFVLGYPDESGAPSTRIPDELGRNGTYGVYRKLQQHVGAFRRFLRGRDDGALLAARMMGRWPSGAPVALAPEADDPVLAGSPDNNRFDYTGDPLGFACPRGAHIRRARPRTSEDSLRHRMLMRRGLPYGDELPPGAPDDGERGLVGFFLMANIEQQFEFVQRKWLNLPDFDGLHDESDPITGADGRDFTWQHPRRPRRFDGLPRFVTVRGGEYFFLPGVTALRHLADLP